MSIPTDVITSVRERTSISEIVGEQIQLKRVGRNYVGLCPFHQEKTPSFNVREEEGTFYCFGCGKKGSVFDYVMETRGYSFREAVSYLANRIGIRVPEREVWNRTQARDEKKRSELLRRAMFVVAQLYTENLADEKASEKARAYLRQRGISDATIGLFHLGFAPLSWDYIVPRLISRADLRQTYKLPDDEKALRQLLRDLGLIRARNARPGAATAIATEGEAPNSESEPSGGYYDLFRERLTFGITRSDGAIIGLGGRLIEKRDDSPKYINSQESTIYQKRKAFFGLSQALSELRRKSSAILVEGYMDVLSMVQRGFTNTIATCGTALTAEHVAILRKLVTRATVMFDGDLAGRRAAAKCFEVFLNSGIDVDVVFLPEGEDPDSLARAKDETELARIFAAGTRSLFDVFVDGLLGDTEESGAAKRARAAQSLVRVLLRVKNPVEREILQKRGAELLDISAESLTALIKGTGSVGPQRPSSYTRRQGPIEQRKTVPQMEQSSMPVPSSAPPQAQLEEFYRSLVVVTAMVPSIAKDILKLQIPGANELAVTALPGRFQDYLCDVSELMPETITTTVMGMTSIDSPAMAPQDSIDVHSEPVHSGPGYFEWQRLLERVGYNVEDIRRDALRRLQLFKGDPRRLCDDLLNETPRFSVRRSLIEDVERLRERERTAADPDARARVLQERLSKKREMGQLSKGQKDENRGS